MIAARNSVYAALFIAALAWVATQGEWLIFAVAVVLCAAVPVAAHFEAKADKRERDWFAREFGSKR